MGGEMRQFYMVMGEFDFVGICEAPAIPTNSARTQSESVAGLAVASDGGRDGFLRI